METFHLETTAAVIWIEKLRDIMMPPTHRIAAGWSNLEITNRLMMLLTMLLVSMWLLQEQEFSLSLLGLCSVLSPILPILMVWQEMNGNT